jgi:4Fe-4S ferredoxin
MYNINPLLIWKSLTNLLNNNRNYDDKCVIRMAFSVHINMEQCTGCGNCVIACPVDALELHTVDPATKEKIYAVVNGKSVHLDVKAELCAGCGVCVKACPYDVIRLSGKGEMVPVQA